MIIDISKNKVAATIIGLKTGLSYVREHPKEFVAPDIEEVRIESVLTDWERIYKNITKEKHGR